MQIAKDKFCLDCGALLVGRADKKFCNDHCRNHYNNSQNSAKNNLVRKINRILNKNRQILENRTPHGKSKAKRDELILNGFNFNYFTNVYTTKNGKIYHFCYEYGYLDLGDGWYALVKKQEYVN